MTCIIGHISNRTTFNVYAHVTGALIQKTAVTFDRDIGRAEPQKMPQIPPLKTMTEFQLNQ